MLLFYYTEVSMDDKEKIENNEVESEKETINTYYEEEETNRKYPSLILLILFIANGSATQSWSFEKTAIVSMVYCLRF